MLTKLIFALGTVVLFTATAAQGKCESSDLDVVVPSGSTALEQLIVDAIVGGDSSANPEVTVLSNHTVCLSVGATRGSFSSISLLINYECINSGLCPVSPATEQFDFGCDGGQWSIEQGGSSEFARDRSPLANFDTDLRMDCSLCGINFGVHDNITHCRECDCDNGIGQNACYFGDAGLECCNVYVNGVCASQCPDLSYVIDDNFNCLLSCEDLGDVVENGVVNYTSSILKGRYVVGTVASVTCNEGYEPTSEEPITCGAAGNWSAEPECQPVDCGPPDNVTNGKLSGVSGTTFGSVATYECNTNFKPVDDNNTRTCQANKEWSKDIRCVCIFENCKDCGITDGKCNNCEDGFEQTDDGGCDRISGDRTRDTCVPCIVVPIVAVILAAIAVTAIIAGIYAYRHWKPAPPTKLKENGAGGLNGVARDNPLYLDPTTVTKEAED